MYQREGGARISFSRRNIVRVPGGALERRYNVVSPPPQVSLFAGNGIRREEGAAIEREIPKATQCYQEIFLRLALCRRRGIGEEDRERRRIFVERFDFNYEQRSYI